MKALTPRIFAIMVQLAASAASAAPATLYLPDGRVFQEAEIVSRDAAYLTIRHSSGMASVPIADLPADLKREIGYDPLVAARQLAREKAAAQAQEAERQRLTDRARVDRRKIFVVGVITEMRSHGFATMDAVRYGEVEEKYKKLEPAEIGENWKPGQKEIVRTIKREIKMAGIQVVGVPSHLQPGARWSGNIWPAGETQLKNQSGAVTGMLTRYATSPELAASLVEEERQKELRAARKRMRGQ